MSQLVLPDHLAPLLGSSPFVDVVGMADPWVVPDRWLEETQQAMRGLVERLPAAQAGEATSPYRPGQPTTLPHLPLSRIISRPQMRAALRATAAAAGVWGVPAGYRSAMSESENESKSDSGVGISDDQLPEDLVPSEDNPLAEGLPPDEAEGGLLTEGKGSDGAGDQGNS